MGKGRDGKGKEEEEEEEEGGEKEEGSDEGREGKCKTEGVTVKKKSISKREGRKRAVGLWRQLGVEGKDSEEKNEGRAIIRSAQPLCVCVCVCVSV